MVGALADFLQVDKAAFEGDEFKTIASVASSRSGTKHTSFSILNGQSQRYVRKHIKTKHICGTVAEEEQGSPECDIKVRTELDEFFRRRRSQWPMVRPDTSKL
jgi:hypothetical protein